MSGWPGVSFYVSKLMEAPAAQSRDDERLWRGLRERAQGVDLDGDQRIEH